MVSLAAGPSVRWATPARPDRWFSDAELSSAPRRDGSVTRFVTSTCLLAAAVTVLDGSDGADRRWAIAAFTIAAAAAAAALGLALGRGEASPAPEAIRIEVADLADRLGVTPPAVRLEPADTASRDAALVGLRSATRLELGGAVVGLPTEVRRWVIAHELAHLGRHDALRRVGHRMVIALAIGLLVLLEFPSGALSLPVWIVVLGVVRLWARWRNRVQERRADRRATRVVPVGVEQLRPVVAGTRTVLEPGLPARLVAPHLSPVARLEAIRRHSP